MSQYDSHSLTVAALLPRAIHMDQHFLRILGPASPPTFLGRSILGAAHNSNNG